MDERPFVDTPVGDLERAAGAAAEAAELLELPSPQPLRVGMNALYRCGDVVLRVGRPSVDPEAGPAIARWLIERGVPTVEPAADRAVRVDDLAVTAWRHVPATTDAVDWTAVGRIVRRVHGLARRELPAGYPVPKPTTFPWWDFELLLAEVDDRLDREARRGLAEAVGRNRGWVEMDDGDLVVCHGDVHPGNVLMTATGPLLIDWDLLCLAPPGWDHAMLLTLADRWGGERRAYPEFAAGYGASLADDPVTARFAELRNVAATLMRVRAGRRDPAADTEAQRRLRFWRGDPDAPMWRAQ